MRHGRTLLAAAAALALAAPAARAQLDPIAFPFERRQPTDDPPAIDYLGDFGRTPFTYTVAGLTATFASDDGVFEVLPVPPGRFAGLSGNALVGVGPELPTLFFFFSAPIGSIRMSFLLDDPTGSSELSTFVTLDDEFVGNAQAPPDPGSPLPEGTIAVPPGPGRRGTFTADGRGFNTVVVFSSAPHFAIDDIVVTLATPTAVPEPASLALTATGLALLAGVARRVSARGTRSPRTGSGTRASRAATRS
jgi:hypothetical protein